jgi:hypothetical protein
LSTKYGFKVKYIGYFTSQFAWLEYFTHPLVPVLSPNYKQHILSLAKHIKVCYSLAELHVRSVYLNSFGWRGRDIYGGRKLQKFGDLCTTLTEPPQLLLLRGI